MARMNIPLEALTSRLNFSGRFDSVRSQSIAARFANLKPVGEFLDLKRLSKPANFGEVQSRVNYNLSYFSSNYAVLFVMLSIYSLLTNLLLLFVIVLVVGGMFGIGKLQGRDLDLGFARATSSQLYTGMLIVAVPLGIWASPISTVLWLIGASGVTIIGHASFMDVRSPLSHSLQASESIKAITTDEEPSETDRVSFFRGGGLGGRPPLRASPLYGRPPGALAGGISGSNGRRGVRRSAPAGGVERYPHPEWEPQQASRYDERFQEIGDSDEDDRHQGVLLDPGSYATREGALRHQQSYAGDELYFTGYDLGQARHRDGSYDNLRDFGYGAHEYSEEGDDEGAYDYRDQRSMAFQAAVRDKEEALIQSALERIGRARAKGKSNVNLSQEEMEALERRRLQQPEPSPSPPAIPAKAAAKGKGSRSSSIASIASEKARKKTGSNARLLTSSSPAKSNSKAKVARKSSAEQALPYPPGTAPPGIMVPGPNGVPVYAPIGYYPPPSPEFLRSQSGSRSTSKARGTRESTPPGDPAYAAYPPRYYPPPSSGMRPQSSGSNRSMPDDIDWYPPPPRNRSTSSAHQQYYADAYGAPLPAAQGRRNVSGPPDVSYPTLRRVPPGPPRAPRYDQQARPVAQHAYSDPPMSARKGSGLRDELESSSSDDGQGVQVDVLPEGSGSGYAISRGPPAEAKKRRGKR